MPEVGHAPRRGLSFYEILVLAKAQQVMPNNICFESLMLDLVSHMQGTVDFDKICSGIVGII